jgi:hypothetical protein
VQDVPVVWCLREHEDAALAPLAAAPDISVNARGAQIVE